MWPHRARWLHPPRRRERRSWWRRGCLHRLVLPHGTHWMGAPPQRLPCRLQHRPPPPPRERLRPVPTVCPRRDHPKTLPWKPALQSCHTGEKIFSTLAIIFSLPQTSPFLSTNYVVSGFVYWYSHIDGSVSVSQPICSIARQRYSIWLNIAVISQFIPVPLKVVKEVKLETLCFFSWSVFIMTAYFSDT